MGNLPTTSYVRKFPGRLGAVAAPQEDQGVMSYHSSPREHVAKVWASHRTTLHQLLHLSSLSYILDSALLSMILM